MSQSTPPPDGYPIKLVRDHTAEIVNRSGRPGALFYGEPGAISAERHQALLRRKLVEEVAEYVEERTYAELLDVLAVIEALSRYHGATLEDLVTQMRADPRGGFSRGVVMYGHHPEFDGKTS